MYGLRNQWAESVDMSAKELSSYWVFGAVQGSQHHSFPNESNALHPHEPILTTCLVLSVRIRIIPYKTTEFAPAPAAATPSSSLP